MKEQTCRKRMRQRESQAIGPPPQDMFSPGMGLRNRAERGQCLSKEGLFPVSELVWRDSRFAFPACPVWLVATAGECSFPEPGEGFRKFCYQHSSSI